MHMHFTVPRPAIALACALALAACADSDTNTSTNPGMARALVNAIDTATDAVTADSHGSASVQVDGQEFRFKVVQCQWDLPHPILTEQRFELSLVGAHPDTPQDVVQVLTARPDAGIDPARVKQALATAFAHGPTLSIVRMDDGAESVAVMTSEMGGWFAIDGNRELTISGGKHRGARVSGRIDARVMDSDDSKVQLEIEANCP